MPIQLRKVKDDMTTNKESQLLQEVDLKSLLPFIQFYQSGMNEISQTDKKALTDIWEKSDIIDNDKVKISSSISHQDVNLLKTKGFIKCNGDIVEFTESGKKALKESILGDEVSTFTKQASKKMVSNNSYDFGDNVLVKVAHPEKIGAKYVNVPKKSFAQKNIEPKKIDEYDIQTKKCDNSPKELNDYTDDELIQIAHLSKKVVKHASDIASQGVVVPVNRIKAFYEDVVEELNSTNR